MGKKAILMTLLLAVMFSILAGCKQTEKMITLEEDNEMKTITIDFSECKYAQDLYETTIKAMDFPDWCGRNLDAIWDMLKGEDPTTVYFMGIKTLNKDLQQEALKIFEVFVEAEQKGEEVHPVSD